MQGNRLFSLALDKTEGHFFTVDLVFLVHVLDKSFEVCFFLSHYVKCSFAPVSQTPFIVPYKQHMRQLQNYKVVIQRSSLHPGKQRGNLIDITRATIISLENCYNNIIMTDSILHSIRILDFTWVLAGPFATRLLADFGAEVIKVHPLLPEEDDTFSRGYYQTWNRNKRSITLNLSAPEGRELARKLVSVSDAVIENFTPRVMENWHLDYDTLKAIKPDIIMVRMSAMGATGSCHDYAGFGPGVQAWSGLTSLTAFPGKPPSGTGFAYADHIAGLNASLALLSALEYRYTTGQGQYIDLSEVETTAGLLGNAILNYTRNGKEPKPAGNHSEQASPHNIYRCRGENRWCAISVCDETQWQNLVTAMGNPDWTYSPEFSTMTARLHNEEKLDILIEQWTSTLPAEEVLSLLQAKGVPAGIVQTAADLAHDPHLRERGFFIEQPARPGQTIDAQPIRLSAGPARYDRPAPEPGHDNDYIYGTLLEITPEAMETLKQNGII